jgi:hypothetical protein
MKVADVFVSVLTILLELATDQGQFLLGGGERTPETIDLVLIIVLALARPGRLDR